MNANLILLLIKLLPDILKLLQTLQDAAKADKREADLKKDLGKINEAFQSKDPEKLKAIFNTPPVD